MIVLRQLEYQQIVAHDDANVEGRTGDRGGDLAIGAERTAVMDLAGPEVDANIQSAAQCCLRTGFFAQHPADAAGHVGMNTAVVDRECE